VWLRASAPKNRRPAEQPVPTSLARDRARWLSGAPGRGGASDFPLRHETAKAICRDLEAAGIPYETDEGVADFHSLRAYFVSALVRSGAGIKEVQAPARPAKPQTTLNPYAKVSVRDLRGAVGGLPAPPATGTDAQHISNRLAHYLPVAGDGSGRELPETGGSSGTASIKLGKSDAPETPASEGFGRVLSVPDGCERRRGVKRTLGPRKSWCQIVLRHP
jgi:hypothetical protein